MRISEEVKEVIVAAVIIAWLLLAAYSTLIVFRNIQLGARLNALETVCKANLLVEGRK